MSKPDIAALVERLNELADPSDNPMGCTASYVEHKELRKIAATLSSQEALLRSGDKLAAALEGMRPLPLVVDGVAAGLLAEWRAARALAAELGERK